MAHSRQPVNDALFRNFSRFVVKKAMTEALRYVYGGIGKNYIRRRNQRNIRQESKGDIRAPHKQTR